MSVPQRGEIWHVDLGMVAKVRPVFVPSVAFGERNYALFHVVPHTMAVRGSQFEVPLSVSWLEEGVFNIQGTQSIPLSNLLRRLGALNVSQLALIEASMRRWLQL